MVWGACNLQKNGSRCNNKFIEVIVLSISSIFAQGEVNAATARDRYLHDIMAVLMKRLDRDGREDLAKASFDYLPTRVFELTVHSLDLARTLDVRVELPSQAALPPSDHC